MKNIDAAGKFFADSWTIVINPDEFSHREPKPENATRR
jgi:hypothetical protein